MKPKEQAIELVGKMCFNDCTDENIKNVIKYALIAVDLLFENSESLNVRYWLSVKKEIEKL